VRSCAARSCATVHLCSVSYRWSCLGYWSEFFPH
jgi:hypothetical protein